MLFDPAAAAVFVESVVTAFSLLGGFMAAGSGWLAARARVAQETDFHVGNEINRGIAEGFMFGAPVATFALIMVPTLL